MKTVYSEMSEAEVLAAIEELQRVQQGCRSGRDPKWEQASAMLAPLFEEMSRRRGQGGTHESVAAKAALVEV